MRERIRRDRGTGSEILDLQDRPRRHVEAEFLVQALQMRDGPLERRNSSGAVERSGGELEVLATAMTRARYSPELRISARLESCSGAGRTKASPLCPSPRANNASWRTALRGERPWTRLANNTGKRGRRFTLFTQRYVRCSELSALGDQSPMYRADAAARRDRHRKYRRRRLAASATSTPTTNSQSPRADLRFAATPRRCCCRISS